MAVLSTSKSESVLPAAIALGEVNEVDAKHAGKNTKLIFWVRVLVVKIVAQLLDPQPQPAEYHVAKPLTSHAQISCGAYIERSYECRYPLQHAIASVSCHRQREQGGHQRVRHMNLLKLVKLC